MDFNEYKTQLLTNLEVKKEYDRLELEYELIRSIIRAREASPKATLAKKYDSRAVSGEKSERNRQL